MLQIEDLTVRYTRHGPAVLDHLMLEARRGERVALVGPSGCGKTTLLRSINASVAIESGRVWVNEVEVSATRGAALRRIRSRIAFIAQKHDLVDRLRVYHNVMAGALGRWSTARALRFLFWPKGVELDEARDALDSVGLAHKLRSRTTELSGGEQQRVAIARALVQHPLIILADEPVASLDPDTACQVLALLCDLAKSRGITLLCSLHHPELVRRYFDRVLRLEAGGLRPARKTVAGERRSAAVPC
ncbi:MAG TPA: ATP-binding cassette domain-containing protein [Candidatus Acidoferrales bacterium]|nr:ATP-binding cassette domain-containing protein [Candidatus Acidoferrales bacterium]